jgi:hypothetical protein
MNPAPDLLAGADADRVREGVAEAIVGGPDGLRKTLQSDPASFLALVAAARVGAAEAERLLRDAVAGARRAGHSWEAIGGLLGVSRQAAQQRFAAAGAGAGEAAAAEAADAAGPAPDRRVVTNVTAFTEMAVLAAEGDRGWHLVDFGPLYLVIERSPNRWAHRRVTLPARAAQRRLEQDGFVAVGTWFPFRYFKRETDLPAAPEQADRPSIRPAS